MEGKKNNSLIRKLKISDPPPPPPSPLTLISGLTLVLVLKPPPPPPPLRTDPYSGLTLIPGSILHVASKPTPLTDICTSRFNSWYPLIAQTPLKGHAADFFGRRLALERGEELAKWAVYDVGDNAGIGRRNERGSWEGLLHVERKRTLNNSISY